ncbi:MAG: hypothetical protein ACYCZK_05115 [Microbacteriaceae bacterium]
MVGTPIGLDCNGLVSPQTIYNFNPNFVLIHNYSAKPGSQAATILQEKGLACGWKNETSGDMIEVAVAHLPSAEITRLENGLVTSSNPVPTYGDEAYFQVKAGVGTAEVFSGPFWIVATGQAFREPGDAASIVNAAIKSLGR